MGLVEGLTIGDGLGHKISSFGDHPPGSEVLPCTNP